MAGWRERMAEALREEFIRLDRKVQAVPRTDRDEEKPVSSQLEHSVASHTPLLLSQHLKLDQPNFEPQKMASKCISSRSVDARIADQRGAAMYENDAYDRYKKKRVKITEAMAEIQLASTQGRHSKYYCAQLQVRRDFPELSADILGCMPNLDAFGPMWRCAPALYIGCGNKTCVHFDMFENMLCLLHGSKTVILWPPYYGDELVTASNCCSLDDLSAKVRAESITFKLRAGDALYLPACWWHMVSSPVGEVSSSISYWCYPPHFKRSVSEEGDNRR